MVSMEQARVRRDTGMLRATDKANRDQPRWSEDAYGYLEGFVQLNPNNGFLAEEVIAHALQYGFEARDGRAWGSVFKRGAREGILRKAGYAPARSSNLSPKTLWEAC